MSSIKKIVHLSLPLILSLIAAIDDVIAFTGSISTKISSVDQIYMFQLNLTDVKTDALISNSEYSDQDLRLSDIYTIGQWGYCKGDMDDDWKYEPKNCSDPFMMYIFDPVQLLIDDISNNTSGSLNLTRDDISLPEDVKDGRDASKVASMVICICTLIGMGSLILSCILLICSMAHEEPKSFKCGTASAVFAFVGCIGNLIAVGSATKAYGLTKKRFNKESDTYGIVTSFGNDKFYGFLWAAVTLSAIATVLLVIILCISRSRSRRMNRNYVEAEKQPMVSGAKREIL